jgi:hypothetical protein
MIQCCSVMYSSLLDEGCTKVGCVGPKGHDG